MGDVGFFGDLPDEGGHLGGFAHDLQFHRAIGQVFHPAADLKRAGEVFDGVAETDVLDPAFEDDSFGDQTVESVLGWIRRFICRRWVWHAG